jgi:predicted RNase H-like nuclease/ADP-ribose pyrophosphatase YjhB (NUDIX family)
VVGERDVSPVPDFVVDIRAKIGSDHPLWLPAVTAVVRRDDAVLLVKRSDNGRWTPVTGIVDPGEEPAVAAAREVEEETGVRVRVDRLASTGAHPEIVHANGDRAAYLDLTFACTWLEGEARVGDDESTDVRWWPVSALPPMGALMEGRIEAALSDDLRARFVAPAGQPADEPEPAEPQPEPLVPSAPVLGVDACPGGWVGVLLDRDLRARVFQGRTITELVELVEETSRVAVVAVDIPIGLPDTSGRAADVEARRVLVGKASSVFSTPTRAALEAATYAEGREANLAATGGSTSVSAQAYALREKVLQVDAWVRSGPGVRVLEVHPEVSFALMAGAPVLPRKKDPAGVAARRAALASHGITAPPWFRGAGFGEDDLLDACAAAWSAVRHSRGLAESLPTQPEVFSDGIPAAIWA